MELKYTYFGYIYITPKDNCKKIVDAMLETNYDMDYCIAESFEPDFIAKLMEAGFLVMSMNFSKNTEDPPYYILLPKLHLVRSALFFENLHIKKTIKRLLGRYELKADVEFDFIIDRCVEKHGADWLTPPLVAAIKEIRRTALSSHSALHIPHSSSPYPASFALYQNNKLVAGEFGVVCGRVYTSYSGFYDEDNAGTAQIILAVKYLQENGFAFFDMGMPLDYKTDLGSVDISPEDFVKLFRAAGFS